ncbi:MAG: MCE family protein [Fibrobacter sp.]|jgi:ABC-type transporter Mla subunit MlaD|nr:MCE family protein [Fibrobacter sp.]
MKISDRTLGYVSLIALIGLFAFIAYCMWEAHHEATTIIQVDFDELGTLQPEDQVVIRGYTVGTIGKVQWLGDRARVQIKFNQPIVIREGTQFNNVNYAIMGQRRLEIIPSKTGKVLPDDYIHTGNFEPGIAEILRYIDNINEQVEMVRQLIYLLSVGDSTHKSANEIIESVISGIEASLSNTEHTLATLQPALNNLFKQADMASNNLLDITTQADSAVTTITETVNEKIALAEKALVKISDGANKTNELINSIEADSIYNKILYSSEMVDKVNKLVEKLNEIVQAIDTKGIKILDENGNPIKPFTWKNLNFIGKTAREKAKERAAKAQSEQGESK